MATTIMRCRTCIEAGVDGLALHGSPFCSGHQPAAAADRPERTESAVYYSISDELDDDMEGAPAWERSPATNAQFPAAADALPPDDSAGAASTADAVNTQSTERPGGGAPGRVQGPAVMCHGAYRKR